MIDQPKQENKAQQEKQERRITFIPCGDALEKMDAAAFPEEKETNSETAAE